MTGRRSGAIPETAPDQTPESQQELDESRDMNAPEPDQNDSTPSRAAADQGREQGNKGGDQGRGCCEPSTPTSSNAPLEPATVDEPLIDSSAASPAEPASEVDLAALVRWVQSLPTAAAEAAAAVFVDPLLARLAAVDRENAELRAAILRNVDTHADLSTQLAAAQAQLAETRDIYALREAGIRVLDDEQCCELACSSGACESCPCCQAGWCVWGHSGEIPERDLAAASNYRIWLDSAVEHNPVAKLLAEIEGAVGVEYDEPIAALSAAPQPEPALVDCRVLPNAQCVHEECRRDVEPPASDEPARCEHGHTGPHDLRPDRWTRAVCPGPAASGTPDGGL